ncbi:MAG: nuclear transport factor 2 family protein [Moorea sp. SIO2B7]|nr:nuclear transport factor 2 family protein [Moorena sp. SIO2B7]
MKMNDKEAVLAVNQAFYDAFTHQDLTGMNQIWFQGTTSFCIHPGGKVLQGWEEIRDSWQQIFRNTNSLEIDVEIISVEITSEIAYVILLESVLQTVRGRKSKGVSLATNIFRKMAHKWCLVHHHGSPVMR